MVQVKKKSVEDAIARAAFKLFSENGFRATKLSNIAAEANVGVGSVYSYFPSKLHILYRVYRPWLGDRIAALENRVEMADTPREKLCTLLIGLWRDIPADNPGLANSLMEALATSEPGSGKKDDLLRWTESQLTSMLRAALPEDRAHLAGDGLLANLMMMAYDGFVINRRLGDVRDMQRLVDSVCDMIHGVEASEENTVQPISSRKTA